MVLTKNGCKAKNPATCPYHSTSTSILVLQNKIEKLFRKPAPPKTLVESYDSLRNKFYEELSTEEQIVLSLWTSDAHLYKQINSALRYGRELTLPQQKFIKNLDSILAKYSLQPEAQTMYRGLRMLPAGVDLKVGATFNEKGYMATTSEINLAQNFMDVNQPMLLKIATYNSVPVGAVAGPQEKEYLLPRDSKFKITKIEHETNSSGKRYMLISVKQL